jgi:hypothetical protein
VIDTSTNQLIPGGNAVTTTTWLNPSPGIPHQIVFQDNQGIQYDWGADALQSNSTVIIEDVTTYGAASNAVTDGTGLQGSTTPQAMFLKQLT